MKSKPLISGLMIIRNGIDLGYPFVEAITQVVKHVDEMVVVYCHSRDDTLCVIEELAKKYNNLRIEELEWPSSTDSGNAIGEVQNKAFKFCHGEYILLVQADEVWFEESIKYAVTLPKKYPLAGLFVCEFNHVFSNFQMYYEDSYHEAVRLFKNIAGMMSIGDGWSIKGFLPHLRADLPIPICHCSSVGWKSSYRKIINHAKLYKDNEDYQKQARMAQTRLYKNNPKANHLKTTSPHLKVIPKILHDMIGLEEYIVRKELL